MKLYVRDEITEIDALVKEVLVTLKKSWKRTFTPICRDSPILQKAQPITLAHHMGAYFEMFRRDRGRLADIYKRMNYCPLGSGALAGTTYPGGTALTPQSCSALTARP